jgi:dihydrofolate reductase
MSYTKTTWTDEVLAGAERFDIKENGGAAFKATMQIVLSTAVSVAGTSVNAANMNHIEQGIYDARDVADVTTAVANAAAILIPGGNVLIQQIISSGAADVFNFTSIPAGYHKLRLVGALKYSATGSHGANPTLRVNGDAGANYAKVLLETGLWSGWGASTAADIFAVVGSHADDAGFITTIDLQFPEYAGTALKWIRSDGIFACAGANPLGGCDWMLNIWRSTAAINRIQILGTFVATLSHLELYGCAL